jgi:hypothetical protein
MCYKSDMFWSVLIIFRDLLNINKASSYQTSVQHAWLIFSNSMKTDWILSQLRQIVGSKYNFNISAFVGFIVWIVY